MSAASLIKLEISLKIRLNSQFFSRRVVNCVMIKIFALNIFINLLWLQRYQQNRQDDFSIFSTESMNGLGNSHLERPKPA